MADGEADGSEGLQEGMLGALPPASNRAWGLGPKVVTSNDFI